MVSVSDIQKALSASDLSYMWLRIMLLRMIPMAKSKYMEGTSFCQVTVERTP
jgi:hypothetical protein